MSHTCNYSPLPSRMPDTSTLAHRTELEVELGSASFAESFKSVFSAIAALEYREFTLMNAHIASALDALQGTQFHYSNVLEIDPNRGMDEAGLSAFRALDLSSALERWTGAGLVPDLQESARAVIQAAAKGSPSDLLQVFTSRVEVAKELLKKSEEETLVNAGSSKSVEALWLVTSAMVNALIAGQLVAIVNRESHIHL